MPEILCGFLSLPFVVVVVVAPFCCLIFIDGYSNEKKRAERKDQGQRKQTEFIISSEKTRQQEKIIRPERRNINDAIENNIVVFAYSDDWKRENRFVSFRFLTMICHCLILFPLLILSSIDGTRLKYRASVKENVDLYYTITSLDKMLAVNYQQSIEFLNSNSPYTTYFLVDGQKLRTSRLIDREEFCRIKLCENSRCHPCEIEMDFVLKENGQPRDIISLILTVEDVNEFRPQFLDLSANDPTIQLNISEGVPGTYARCTRDDL